MSAQTEMLGGRLPLLDPSTLYHLGQEECWLRTQGQRVNRLFCQYD